MTDSYSDSNPQIFAEKFQIHPMALTKLTGLPNKVVQNAYYDGDECFKMYATQTGSGSDRFSSRVYRSTNDPMIDYLPMDGNFVKSGKATFDSKPLMVLDNSFARIAGHTQTLIADGYLMLTGINDLNFSNLLKLLHKKYGASVPISKWVKDIDNPSAKAFRRIASTSDLVTGNIYHKPLAGQDSGVNYWTTRIGAFRFNDSADDNTQMIKLGKYNILTGFDIALKNSFRESPDELNFIKSHDLYRIEASVDRSHNNILFAIQVGQEEKYSRVYFLVYDYGTISGKLIENLSDINMQQGLYYNDDNTDIHKVPDADLPLSDTEIDQALEWYHECLKIDDFAIDISQYNDVAHSCIHTDNLDTNIHRKIPSYQGFTVDRLKNIYIACGAGPENTHNYRIHDYDNEIICLPNYGRHKKNEAIHAKYFSLNYADLVDNLNSCFDHFDYYYLEIEGLQDLEFSDYNHSIHVMLGMHNQINNQKTEHNIDLIYNWEEAE